MFDTVAARRLMVDGQVRTADVTDAALLDAMLTVPRERFMPPRWPQLAYLDGDIQIAPGRALLKPMVLAKLIQAARVTPDDRVLDLGCGTGYSTRRARAPCRDGCRAGGGRRNWRSKAKEALAARSGQLGLRSSSGH